MRERLGSRRAVIAAIGLIGIAAFQAAIAAGAPLGRAAWGALHFTLGRGGKVLLPAS